MEYAVLSDSWTDRVLLELSDPIPADEPLIVEVAEGLIGQGVGAVSSGPHVYASAARCGIESATAGARVFFIGRTAGSTGLSWRWWFGAHITPDEAKSVLRF